jgi:hypothetical protein
MNQASGVSSQVDQAQTSSETHNKRRKQDKHITPSTAAQEKESNTTRRRTRPNVHAIYVFFSFSASLTITDGPEARRRDKYILTTTLARASCILL